jgi:hypothetical protein
MSSTRACRASRHSCGSKKPVPCLAELPDPDLPGCRNRRLASCSRLKLPYNQMNLLLALFLRVRYQSHKTTTLKKFFAGISRPRCNINQGIANDRMPEQMAKHKLYRIQHSCFRWLTRTFRVSSRAPQRAGQAILGWFPRTSLDLNERVHTII